jgi:hypothetical protein
MTTLLSIYAAFTGGQLTEEDASKAFGLDLRTFRYCRSRYGARLPSILAVLDQVKSNQLKRKDACEQLGIAVRTFNHMMNTWGVQRDIKHYVVKKAAAEVKRDVRKVAAISYISGAARIEDAATDAQVSVRQIRRWVSELISKHFGMVWGDLKDLDMKRRSRLAQEIRRAEDIEHSTEQAVQEIVTGRKTLAEEVVSRLADRRSQTRIGARKRV